MVTRGGSGDIELVGGGGGGLSVSCNADVVTLPSHPRISVSSSSSSSQAGEDVQRCRRAVARTVNIDCRKL